MTEAYPSQLQFQCSFLLRAVDSAKGIYDEVLRAIRSWLQEKCDADAAEFNRKWFYEGGSYASSTHRHMTLVTSCVARPGLGPDVAPDYWAARLVHPCQDFAPRTWRTDLALSRNPAGDYHFFLRLSHQLRLGYIGEEPDPPAVTTPFVVRKLLRARGVQSFAGDTPLREAAEKLSVGKGKAFEKLVLSQDRLCPLLYISRSRKTGMPLLDAGEIARRLAGVASVWVADAQEVDEELSYLLPSGLQTDDGMVRVYQPNVVANSDYDTRRHRYFTRRDFEEKGSDYIAAILVRNLVQRSRLHIGDNAVDVDALRQVDLSRRFEAAKKAHGSNEEWIQLLEDQNKSLEKSQRNLIQKVEDLETSYRNLSSERDQLSHQVGIQRDLANAANVRAKEAHDEKQKFQSAVQIVHDLEELPASLSDVVDLLVKLYPDRIAFTERGLKSAQDYDDVDVAVAWRVLRSMATELVDLFGDSGRGTDEIMKEYRTRTGIEIAFSEGKMTKNDTRLMRARKDQWNGRDIDVTPHVKYGNKPPAMLRVYFAVVRNDDTGRPTIVVGWCGDHLETSGTRRRKQR